MSGQQEFATPTSESLPDDATGSALDAFLALARSRRSIRRYAPAPVDRALVETLLDAAIWAPSAHNRQPWRFCVVTEAATKERLSKAMAAAWRADLAGDGAAREAIERRIAISHARLTGAPVLIVPCVTLADMDVYPDAVRSQAERTMAVQSVALACQNLLLAAHAAGLGACWMCAPLFVPALVRQALELPEDWEPQAILTLGHPAEEKQKAREPLASRIVWR
ncbi:MAG: nitroreductase family protein [Caldilinea sp.]|nr:nitroreductase family protein [Caldilinea sp.]MCB0040259.1 nitroreductase family protein [Caldilinea sp.]MCB0051592.1 nitroreductase family protein [Caldilinea sp.]MCO5209613.1 nitroreductase family protein [Caldilinea sp.]MCW5844475.1 nitroreductase family protein [Caldilinea sp.]